MSICLKSSSQNPNLKLERSVQESKDSLSNLAALGAPAEDSLTALLTQRHPDHHHHHHHHSHHPALIPLPAEASSTSSSSSPSQFPANYNLNTTGLHRPMSDPDFPGP